MSEEYLTTKEVLGILTVSLRALRYMIADGKIPHSKVGGRLRIKRSTVTAILDGRMKI